MALALTTTRRARRGLLALVAASHECRVAARIDALHADARREGSGSRHVHARKTLAKYAVPDAT